MVSNCFAVIVRIWWISLIVMSQKKASLALVDTCLTQPSVCMNTVETLWELAWLV